MLQKNDVSQPEKWCEQTYFGVAHAAFRQDCVGIEYKSLHGMIATILLNNQF